MKIFSNQNNPAGLKLLISASFAGKDVDVEHVSLEDNRFECPKRLPILQLDSGVQLFSANAGARFILPPGDGIIGQITDEWLEFEASQLTPTILNGFNSAGKIDNISRENLVKLLAFLDNALSGKQYLTGDSITVADICIWSTLFPVITEPQYLKELFGDNSNVKTWFDGLQRQERFRAAVSKVCPKAGVSCLQHLAAATWCPVAGSGDNDSKLKSAPQPDSSSETQGSPLSDAELTAAREAWQRAALKETPKSKVVPVLPVKGERNILITSALPYVNNVPHLGNIIGCVLSGDVFARFCRLRNCNTLYICGTDEYGTATETKALEEGLTPQQICDKYFKIHEEIYRWFNIEFDHFGRTTTKEQTTICQEMFLDLHERGLMTTQSVEQLLCEKCNRFLADRFVEGTCPKCKYEDARGDQCDGCGTLINATELINARCKVCSTTPVVRMSEQFFLELPEVEPRLREWLDTVTDGWSNNAKMITRSWLKEGLKSRCITRDLKWGIPVPLPEYSNKVFYVWFDAPIGYMSMTNCYTEEWKRWWQPEDRSDVTLYQFMAKDNVPFHSVMFPTSLIGSQRGYVLVNHLMATEYLNYEDGKFSKSRGVGVFGNDARDTGIASDVWRFYLLYVRPEAQDSSFSWVDLATKNNSELLNNLGNFVNRALMFAEKSFDGLVPKITPDDADVALLALVNRELQGYIAALEKAKLRDGIRHILNISRHGNQYMQVQQPWVLLKGTDAEKSRAGTVIGICCNICCVLATLLQPYMPATSLTLRKQLNAPPETCLIQSEITNLLPAGHTLGKPAPLFTKIEMEHIEQLKKKYAGNQKSRTPEADTQKKSVAQLTEAVTKQGELVRQLKAGGAAKGDLQPHVATLLELKKQLAAAEANQTKPVASANGEASSVAVLTEAVAKQGELVRQLKTSGAAKGDWQPHVATLLELKKQLAAAEANQTKPVASANGEASSVAVLTEAVAKQGELVRQLKTSGAAKGDWQPHVATLLELKKQLAAAEANVPVNKPAVDKSAINEPAVNVELAAELEAHVTKQADLVREMKTSGASKADVTPQVAILLDLKKQLATAKGEDSVAKPPAFNSKSKKKGK